MSQYGTDPMWKKIQNNLEKAANDDTGSHDHDNMIEDVKLEQEAIDIYTGQAQNATPEVKKLLEHVIEEEGEHAEEFQKLLRKLDKPADGPQDRLTPTTTGEFGSPISTPGVGFGGSGVFNSDTAYS